jgi:hypothetical protein
MTEKCYERTQCHTQLLQGPELTKLAFDKRVGSIRRYRICRRQEIPYGD